MKFRSGFIGLIGQPNAGKSSLVNAIIGERVAIVTRKPQTTRKSVTGIYTDDESQLVFIDAPGVVKAESGLNLYLQREYERVIDDSDALVAVLNLDEKKPEALQAVVDLAANSGKPWVAVISKTDLPQIHRVSIIRTMLEKYDVPVVTVTINRPDELKSELLLLLKPLVPETGGPLYDTEIYTTQNLRELAAEVIREKCFERLHQEIPYGLAVQVLKFDESSQSLIKIHAEIIVAKTNYRQIVVGSGGKALKSIGRAARLDLEKVVGQKIFLDLHVKVRENWMRDANFLKELGYGHPERE